MVTRTLCHAPKAVAQCPVSHISPVSFLDSVPAECSFLAPILCSRNEEKCWQKRAGWLSHLRKGLLSECRQPWTRLSADAAGSTWPSAGPVLGEVTRVLAIGGVAGPGVTVVTESF